MPPCTNTNYSTPSGSGTNICIPESAIATQLRIELNKCLQNSDNLESKDNNTNEIDILSENICGIIILAFERIYNKYINDDSAIYMINISSRNRLSVKYLFDSYYYKINGKNTDNHKKSTKFSFTLTAMSRSALFGFGLNSDHKEKNDTGMTFLRKELKSYLKNNSKTPKAERKSEKELLLWLLSKILLPMDSCLREIIFLMNDSFMRFKAKNSRLFEELCQHVLDS